jgi:hypothetical protein
VTPHTPNTPSSLVDSYQDLRDALNAFATEAAQFHKCVAVTDDATRALFTALSRITAYSDQLQMIMALMREDVRITSEIGADSGLEFESLEFANCFYEWLRAARMGGQAVN